MPIQSNHEYTGEKFVKLHLEEEVISHTHFNECTFSQSVFYHAKFSECTFDHCMFLQCDLSLSTFPRSTFIDARFKESKLLGTNWSTVNTALSSFTFHKCILTHSNFSGLKLNNTDFSGSILKEANFSFTQLKKSNFTDTDLENAIFTQSHVEESDFRSASHLTLDPTNNFVKKAKFSMYSALGLLDGFEVEIET